MATSTNQSTGVYSADSSPSLYSFTPKKNNQAFSSGEYDRRVHAIQEDINSAGLDILLVHTPENINYLTGFETSGYFEYQVLAIPAAGSPALLIRNTERFNVNEFTWLDHAYLWTADMDYFDTTARLIDSLDISRSGRVGLEFHSWFVSAQVGTALKDKLSSRLLVDAGRIVERRRLVKSKAEQEYMRAAARIADKAMSAAVSKATEGNTERDVLAAAYHEHFIVGGEYPALPLFVKSGERLVLQHATATEKILQNEELVHLELLGVKRRYHAGLIRTVHIGTASKAARQSAAIILDIQEQLLNDLKPGVAISEITKRGRSNINAIRGDYLGDARLAIHAGDPTEFKLSIAPYPGTNRRLGYSMGIGFPPTAGEAHTADFRESSPYVLEPGMTFHMLAGVTPELSFSETVLVTDDGWERLTQAPRKLFES